MPEQPLSSVRFYELDAFRGLAALLVVLFHFTLLHQGSVLYYVFKVGTTGVDFFFIISGFVIFQSISNVKRGSDFLIHRFARLFPSYWVALLLVLLWAWINATWLGVSTEGIDSKTIAYNFTMFQYYGNVDNLDDPYWTLTIEMLFYLIVFVLFVCKQIRFLIPFLILTILGTILISVCLNDPVHSYRNVLVDKFPFVEFAPLFLAGIIFYRVRSQFRASVLDHAILVFALFAQFVLFRYSGRGNIYISPNHYSIVISIYFIAFYLFSVNKMRWVVNPITLFLGKISYPLYLIHNYFSIYFLVPLCLQAGINRYVAYYAIALPLCILLATGISFTVERRFSPWLRNQLLIRTANFF